MPNGIIPIDNTSVQEYDDNSDSYLDESDKTWSNNSNIVDKKTGDAISFDYVYKKIAQIIDTGNSTLELLQAIDPDESNPATLGATASLINSIRACIAEFTKIHLQYIKFQNTVKLEQVRLANKKDFAVFKKKLAQGQISEDKQSELVEIKSGDILDFIKYKEEAKEKEEENK